MPPIPGLTTSISRCNCYPSLCNKLPQNLVAWNNNIYYLGFYRSRIWTSLSWSSSSGTLTGCSHVSVQQRKDQSPSSLTCMVVDRSLFLAGFWTEGLNYSLAVGYPYSLPYGPLLRATQKYVILLPQCKPARRAIEWKNLVAKHSASQRGVTDLKPNLGSDIPSLLPCPVP